MYKQDYILRLIEDLSKIISKIFFDKTISQYESFYEKNNTQTDELYIKLNSLLALGNINEAENLLFEEMDTSNKEYLKIALDFYNKVNDFDDEYLEKNNYTREEIEEGLKAISKRFGIVL